MFSEYAFDNDDKLIYGIVELQKCGEPEPLSEVPSSALCEQDVKMYQPKPGK